VNRSAESRDAELVHQEEAKYPDELDGTGVAGTVTVRYTVDESGHVTDVMVTHSSGNKVLDECAKRTIKRFRYKPAIQDGQPRAVQRTKSFVFRSDG